MHKDYFFLNDMARQVLYSHNRGVTARLHYNCEKAFAVFCGAAN